MISVLARSKYLAPVLLSLIATWHVAQAQQSPMPSQTFQAPAQRTQAAPSATPPSPYLSLQKMNVEANYGGPLADTLIQRLRDPIDGTICYLYLPISVPHGPTLEDGMVRYGANPVGSISCFPSQAAARKK